MSAPFLFCIIMKKFFTLFVLCVFSLCTIHAEITWSLSDDGTLTISGTDMPNYRDGSTFNNLGAPWFSQREVIKKNVIRNGVTSIGDYAFAGCSGLTSVTFGNSVTSIGYQAFAGCSSLTSVAIPNSVTTIERSAFSGCPCLSYVTIPNSVTSIAVSVFAFCPALTSIIVDKGNTTYDSRENCNAIIETKSNTLISGCKNTIIPNSVTTIGDYAFRGCSGLTSVTFGNSVTSIGYQAFYRCSALAFVIIGSSVTKIWDYAFNECFGLTSITSEAKTPPDCGQFCFGNVQKSIPVYVPANSVENLNGLISRTYLLFQL